MIPGSLAMLLGALDPMEGSVVILIGSALVTLGTFLDPDPAQHRWLRYRLLVFGLIALGVGAVWGLTAMGGFGGSSGHTMWWGVLILPYLIGWAMGVCGPGNPRWLLVLGIAAGLWFLTLCGMVAARPPRDNLSIYWMVLIVIGTTGLATIVGCLARLRHFHSLAARP